MAQKNKPKYIAVAGNIGAGKSSLTGLLGKNFNWKTYYESVDDNPYLSDFYDDMRRWSFNLQIFFLSSRFRHQKEMHESGKSLIQDRTIYEDVEIFAKNLHDMRLMSDRDYENYCTLFHEMVHYLKPPDLLAELLALARGIAFLRERGCRVVSYYEPVSRHQRFGGTDTARIAQLHAAADNPDVQNPELQTPSGVYSENCGLDEVHMSWGHDEYLYHVVMDHLPEPALYMIRYHSFYAWHREGAYTHLTNEKDREMLKWVQAFNPYDLYSKGEDKPDVRRLRPFYEELIAEYFPPVLRW
jgi:hypothetical protein